MMQNRVTHCPSCHKPLLNEGEFWGWAEFSLKCSWCQEVVTVSIQPRISTSLKPAKQPQLKTGLSLEHSLLQEYLKSGLKTQRGTAEE